MLLLDTSESIASFSSMEAWNWLIHFFIIALALLLANVFRRNIPILRKSLMPSALIAGCFILLLKLIPGFENILNKQAMEIVTYHALGLGFVALALKNNRIQSRSTTTKIIETGCVTASTYVLQGIIGLAVTIPLFLWWNRETFFYSSGLLLPMGYGQGPGQALNFGVIYQNSATDQGISFSGADFGLALAAMGFIVGSVIGVIYMNILRRKNKLSIKNGDYHEQYTLSDYEDKNEIPHSESIDKLTVQLCLVLVVYSGVYGIMKGVECLELGAFGTKTIKPMVWGFNFLWGTLLGVLMKSILNGFKRAKIMKREYINNYMLNRISGTCFDVMIVAGTAAISFENLSSIWLPFLLVAILGAIATFWYLNKVCAQLYPDYSYEGFFSMFGMLTGTASNGMILLREIDPKFETPAANNLVLQTIPAIVFGFPVLLLMGYAPQGFKQTIISLVLLVLFFVITSLWLFRTKIFKKKNK